MSTIPPVSRALAAYLAIAACLLAGGCQRAFFQALNAGGPRVERVDAVHYGAHPRQALDLYLPRCRDTPCLTRTTGAPVVLFLYGGRWQSGRRSDYAFVGERLASHGVLTAVADYRIHPEVRFPAFVSDAARALRATRALAAAHGGDPERIFLAGHSAGAHIAALLALDPRYLTREGLTPEHVRGVIGLAGPYDFLPLHDADLREIFGPEPDWPASQPVNFVDGDAPPFLLLHGGDDRLVLPRNSRRLAFRLRAAGVAVRHRELSGIGHVRLLAGLRHDRFAAIVAPLLEFIDAAQHAPARSQP